MRSNQPSRRASTSGASEGFSTIARPRAPRARGMPLLTRDERSRGRSSAHPKAAILPPQRRLHPDAALVFSSTVRSASGRLPHQEGVDKPTAMAMIGNLRPASDAQIERLLANPAEITRFLYGSEAEACEQVGLSKAWH